MSDNIVNFSKKKKQEDNDKETDIINHISLNFLDYLEMFMNKEFENEDDVRMISLSLNPEEFNPERVLLYVEDDNRSVCIYSKEYTNQVMQMFGVLNEESPE